MASDFPLPTWRSIKWFKKAHDESRLVLKRTRERSLIWSVAQKSLLIDSVLRGYPVPEIYVQEKTDEPEKEHYVVVDGRQRVQACLEYIDDKFALALDQSHWGCASFSDLALEDRHSIYTYSFLVRRLPPLNETDLLTIVSRLNLIAMSFEEPTELDSSQVDMAEPDIWSPAGLYLNTHGE